MTRIHGITSIGFFLLTQVLALTVMFLTAPLLGLLYSVFFVAASLAIVFFYCAKCPVRLSNCSHVFIGPVTQIFPERKQKSYSKLDITIVIISLAGLILIPQVWLWDHPVLAAGFWVSLVIAGIQINRFVCTRCENHQCIACRNSKSHS